MGVVEYLSNVNSELIIRLIVAICLGFIIGLERELTNKSAGLRTHILVCLGSAVFTIISIYGFMVPDEIVPDGVRIQQDPARIAAQILTGIGFIGGGAVLHHGISISGLTTAASLWITASIGMAAGTGSYTIAITTTILSILVLVLNRKLERGFLSKHTMKGARIKATILCTSESISDIQDWFYKEFNNIAEMNIKKSSRDDDIMKLVFILDVYDSNPINKTYKKLRDLKNIESLTLQQIVDES